MIFTPPRSLKTQLIVALVSGVVASAALPPLGIVVLILLLAVPFGLLMTSRTGAEALWLGWATGFGWFAVSLWWISVAFVTSGGGHVLLIPFAALGMPLLLGLFWGIAFMVTAVIVPDPRQRPFVLAITLSLAEYGRGFILTGFPWNAPGMIFAQHEVMLAAASFFGLWGLSLVAILIPLLPLVIAAGRRGQAVVFLGLVMSVPLAGAAHLDQPDQQGETMGMTVRLVQPNISQRDKWDREKRPDHLVRLMQLSRQPGAVEPALIIWPETAFAGFVADDRPVFEAVTRHVTGGDTALITGALDLDEQPQLAFYNSAVLVDRDGRQAASYAKQHLVPFGEYAPLRDLLPFVDALAGPSDFSPGEGVARFAISRDDGRQVSILPLICYEAIFPAAVRRAAHARAAGLMVTITNDAWFGDTIGPRQHLAMARMRSAELGLPMLRAANNGISAVIDSRGRLVDRLGYGREGVIDARLGGMVETVYHRFGDRVFGIMVLVLVMMAVLQQGLTAVYSRR
ncbi:MAG: apolipoprotein N-acyltransferase [Candidatus Puniceispirillales bacterium]